MDYCLDYEHLKDEHHIFKSISYDELISLLDTFHSGLIYIGGPWCKNCQAIIDIVNQVGKKRGLDCIYNYDPRFINIYGEEEDLRDCKSLEIKLKYYAIVEKLGYKTNELVQDTLIPKIHVPFFAAIKNGVCVGYYFAEYVRDGSLLHAENDNEDKTVDFVDNLVELIHKFEDDKRFL
ncbi:MAG: hypothetical protein ACI35S_02195 [Anaeroplasma sp.]